MKYGGVKLVLWTETSHLGEMMQSCKCFQNVSKMSTLTYNLANSIILMNAVILNIIHNIFNIGTGYDYPDLPELGNNNEQLGLPERLSTGIQFRFRNLFHVKKSGNRNFICYNYLVLLLHGKNKISKTKETAEWTCSVCKFDVHLYASIVCDVCLECVRTSLNMLASKRHRNPARTGYADSAITKESNLIISDVIPSL